MDERLRVEPDPNAPCGPMDPSDVVEPDNELYPPPSEGSRRCMIYGGK